MRAAIYARVSTSNGQDPSVQTRELREYCQRRGWEIAGEYVDAGVSGAKDSRPELADYGVCSFYTAPSEEDLNALFLTP